MFSIRLIKTSFQPFVKDDVELEKWYLALPKMSKFFAFQNGFPRIYLALPTEIRNTVIAEKYTDTNVPLFSACFIVIYLDLSLMSIPKVFRKALQYGMYHSTKEVLKAVQSGNKESLIHNLP